MPGKQSNENMKLTIRKLRARRDELQGAREADAAVAEREANELKAEISRLKAEIATQLLQMDKIIDDNNNTAAMNRQLRVTVTEQARALNAAAKTIADLLVSRDMESAKLVETTNHLTQEMQMNQHLLARTRELVVNATTPFPPDWAEKAVARMLRTGGLLYRGNSLAMSGTGAQDGIKLLHRLVNWVHDTRTEVRRTGVVHDETVYAEE